MNAEVHLLIGCGYENSEVLRAFAAKEYAARCLDACIEHSRSEPECPEGDEESEWDAYNKAHDEWEEKHPGGKRASMWQSFMVESHTVINTTPTGREGER